MFNELIINKNNLINNIKQVKKNNPNSLVCAMVKANAYGVGLDEVVSIIDDYVDYYGVACFFEAKKVQTLTNKKILIVGAVDKKEYSESYEYSCGSIDDIKAIINTNKKIKIHIKINSGMNRYGFKNLTELKKAIKLTKKYNLDLVGVYTHFATDDEYVDLQMKNFSKFVSYLKKYYPEVMVHTDNSRVNKTKNHHLDMVRIGFDLYHQNDDKFSPVVSIRTRIVNLIDVKKGELVGYDRRYIANKKLEVAIVPIGYADGFDLRYIGLNINILNYDCKVLNICMDCTMIDVSNVKIKKGDTVYLLNHNNTPSLYANHARLSEYQVMTNFSNMRCDRLVSITSNSEYE